MLALLLGACALPRRIEALEAPAWRPPLFLSL
jgi:hypothetical protein